MRRAALAWLVGGSVFVGVGGTAAADAPAPSTSSTSSTTVQAEGGAEVDSNVQRVETGPGLQTTPISSSVGRLGAKLDHRGRIARGAYAMHLGSFARIVGSPDAQSESVALLAGDLKWLRPLGTRPVSVGFAVLGADAIALDSTVEDIPECDRRRLDRTFRTAGADALIVMRNTDDRSLTLGFGGRRFSFKPCSKFDWSGPSANARLDLTLWESAEGTRSLELAAFAGVEARAYNDVALANACENGEMPVDPKDCSAATSLPRHDRYHRVGVELTWVGSVVAALGYTLSVTDTNSYGQSLVRHRVNLSATTDLPWGLYGTAYVTLQYDQYLDGLIVEKDLQNQTFTTLDDENRSSFQVRIARQVTKTVAIETRFAHWRDIGGGDDAAFRRSLLYAGAVFNR
jgi:hypothetical protein